MASEKRRPARQQTETSSGYVTENPAKPEIHLNTVVTSPFNTKQQAGSLVTNDLYRHRTTSGGRSDWHTRTGGGINSELDNARLIVAEGALAAYIHRDRRGVHFKPAVDAGYRGVPDSCKYIAALSVGGDAQGRVDDTTSRCGGNDARGDSA